MGEPKYGEDFVEFDEAIAIHTMIVEAERELGESHPFPAGRDSIQAVQARDQQFLTPLQQLGRAVRRDGPGRGGRRLDG